MSAVTSSIKTSVLVPLAAIHALTYVRCLQHVWWILWYASDHESFFSFSILFSSPSFWYKFVISPKNFFSPAGSFMCFPCCKPSYFHSWKCLWFINLDNNMCNSWKYSWVGWMFFKLFFNHKKFCHHTLELSSVVFQAFCFCWAGTTIWYNLEKNVPDCDIGYSNKVNFYHASNRFILLYVLFCFFSQIIPSLTCALFGSYN